MQYNPPLLLLKRLKTGVGMLESVPIDNRFAGMHTCLFCVSVSPPVLSLHILLYWEMSTLDIAVLAIPVGRSGEFSVIR